MLSKDQQDRKYMMFGLKIVGDFGATIAIPVVVFVLIAQWLEGKYGGEPYLTIIAFVLAALLTAKMIHSKAKMYGKQYEIISKEDVKNKNNDRVTRNS